MNNYFAFLWLGTDLPSYSALAFDVRYVVNLKRNIHRHDPNGRLIVMTDEHYDPTLHEVGIDTVRFTEDDCGGWSKVLEVFRPDLRPIMGQHHMALGLDTVIMKDPTWLFRWEDCPIGLPPHPTELNFVSDPVITFDVEGAEMAWEFYQHAKKTLMRQYCFAGRPSEMVLLQHLWRRNEWSALEARPDRLLSYREHIKKLNYPLDMADIVYFHGQPKPADLPKNDPVRQEWERQ